MNINDQLHTAPRREIIEHFAQEIDEKKYEGVKPETTVIPFRDDVAMNKDRKIYLVPVELLRFRKDNGRIASDVESYILANGPLDENSFSDQEKLRQFLEEKDPEKTEDLMSSLDHEGQREPAVITADGFLINGNRRKMALEKLLRKTHDQKFARMRVVILPGKGAGEGGEPTNTEIELLENAYQFHHDGKSEYYNFDRALSIRRKESLGISLEQQLRSDSRYAKLDDKKFDAEVKKYRQDFLGTLDCIDSYLAHIGRPGDYSAISGGRGDREGRWQAFVDYYKSVYSKLHDTKQRVSLGVEVNEIGAIEDSVFKIMRQGSFGKNNEIVPSKINDIMRRIPKVLEHSSAKKELLKLKVVDEGKGVSDSEWIGENHKVVSQHVTEAFRMIRDRDEQDEPLVKLEKALNILTSENIKPENVRVSDLPQGMKTINDIEGCIKSIKNDFWSAIRKTEDGIEQLRSKGR